LKGEAYEMILPQRPHRRGVGHPSPPSSPPPNPVVDRQKSPRGKSPR